jgi:OmpA-OmpF porin, OOP family
MCAYMTKIRLWLMLALMSAAMGVRSADAQDFLNQDWVLNGPQSHVYMQTEKLEGVIEKHQFNSVEGGVNKDGDAGVKIDLNSLETHIDLRNVRMRFVLFETFKFPSALITTRLDKNRLRDLDVNKTVNYPLTLTVNMHGVSNQIQTVVSITRTSDTTVSVATTAPIVVTAESFGFAPGIAKLSDAVGGIRIVPQASITFDLVFGTGALAPELEAARANREKTKVEQEAKNITAEGCETRLTVISETNAIYFKTGSAELDKDSEPLLDSGADIARRCPSVKFEVDGHTDNVGPKGFNQTLSEQRAKSVVDYLATKGVGPERIHAVGYGDTRPVAPNTSDANRAKNRRIEFKVTKN